MESDECDVVGGTRRPQSPRPSTLYRKAQQTGPVINLNQIPRTLQSEPKPQLKDKTNGRMVWESVSHGRSPISILQPNDRQRNT